MSILSYIKRDWPMIPSLVFTIGGSVWALFDLFSEHGTDFHPVIRISGFFLMVAGGIMELWVRNELVKKSKFHFQL